MSNPLLFAAASAASPSGSTTLIAPGAAAAAALGHLNPFWVFVLVLGFPLLMLLLGEVLRWLQRHQPAFVAPLAILRNWTLPALALYLLLVDLLARPRSAVGVRISETLVWITLILAALSLLNVILFEGAPQGSWQAKVPKLFRDLGRFLLVLIGSAIVLSSVWGADLGGFLTALGVGSLVLGLALQDSLGNIFSGVALLFEQPIGMGDWVQIGDSLGEVVEVNWRSVHLKTFNDDLRVIPNSELAKGQFINFSRPTPLHRVEVPISFSYDDPPNRVRQLLIGAALEIPAVLDTPPPDVVVVSYGDFAINYKVQVFAPDYRTGDGIQDEINRRIWYLAKRHGLTMPYPMQQEVPYESTAPTPVQQGVASLQLLKSTPGFASLSSERLEQLLADCQVLSYATHEVVVHRLMPLDGLYLILSGEAELVVPDVNGRSCSLGVLLQGECFGEKSSLLHGRIAETTVRACDDLEVLVIPAERLQEVLVESPRLASDLAEVIEIRQRAAAKVLEGGLQRRRSAATPLPQPVEGPAVDGSTSGGVQRLLG
jgi:small-conductance mechanosensitive channel/CRP-like cAMP-binding protein